MCQVHNRRVIVFRVRVFLEADEAFVTLATNDSYAKGAMVLGQSLRNHNTTRKLVALIGPHVAEPCRSE